MASQIDPTKPPQGQALTADVRQNFQYAKGEIEALQSVATEQYANLAAFPAVGLVSKLYIAANTGVVYRWDGATYVAIGGSGSGSYTHTQAVASNEWIINHNLGFNPDTTVYDTGGQVVGVLVLNISVNQARVYAEPPLAGTARCE
jgi:hypothetical protein